MTTKSPGQLAYEADIAENPRNPFNDRGRPPWDALPDYTQAAWELRADADAQLRAQGVVR